MSMQTVVAEKLEDEVRVVEVQLHFAHLNILLNVCQRLEDAHTRLVHACECVSVSVWGGLKQRE